MAVVTVDQSSDEVDAEAPAAAPPRRFPTLATVTAGAFALWGLLIGIQPLSDNSFLTHVATGRLILDRGSIPSVDPYSFTARGEPWTVQSWLASVAYAASERLAGLGGIRVLNAVLVALLAALVWRLTAPARTLVPRILLTGIVAAAGTGLWVERPLLFGLLGLGVLLLVAEDACDPRWLLPIMWIWVNTHGSFPLAFVLLAVLGLGRRLDGEHPRVELRALAWAAAGTVLAALNPVGPKLLAFPLEVIRRRESFAVIVEWRPPGWDNPWQILFALQAVAALALLVRRFRWRTALPLLVFTLLAVTSARNVVVASLVLVPGMALGLWGWGSIDGARRSTATLAGGVTAVVMAVVLTVAALSGPHATLSAYPEDAVTWLDRTERLDDQLVAPDFVGNYLEARYGTEVPVFVDDRVDMYPAQVIEDAIELVRGQPGWAEVLERRRAGVVLWQRDAPLARLLRASPAWRPVWNDADWEIFVPT